MANPLRQRLGALLARPTPSSSLNSLQTTRDAVTKRFYAAKAHQHDDAAAVAIPWLSKFAPQGTLTISPGSNGYKNDDETHKWRSITIAAYILCIGLGAYTFANEEHGHLESPAYSYLHIRNKEFPWGEDGLFEYKHESHEEH